VHNINAVYSVTANFHIYNVIKVIGDGVKKILTAREKIYLGSYVLVETETMEHMFQGFAVFHVAVAYRDI
jgi:hypothetical protein